MRTLIVSAVALGLLLLGTFAKAETPSVTSPIGAMVQQLTVLSSRESASPTRVCCQVSGSFGNLFVSLSEGHCAAVPGMPTDENLCRN